jgi:hypothetical protein
MVHCSRWPTRGGMAVSTTGSQVSLMEILSGVAGIAVGRSACINAIGMATGTGYADVFASQLVDRQVMVHRGRRPTRGSMAGGTIGSKTSIMKILGSMAGITGCGCTFVSAVGGMATFTSRGDMLPGQLECRLGVSVTGRNPDCSYMAGGTIRS